MESAAATSSHSCWSSRRAAAPVAGSSASRWRPTGTGSSAKLDSVRRVALSSPARSIRASGLPPVAAAIWVATAGSIGSGSRREQQPRRPRSGARPASRSAGTPAIRCSTSGPSRLAKTRTADSASSRRATKASASSDSESRKWVSSTAQTTGAYLAGGREQPEDAESDQEPVRRRPRGRAGGHAQRLLVALGQRRDVLPQRDHQPVERGVRDRRLGLVAVGSEHPDAGRRGRGRLAAGWSSRCRARRRAAAHRRGRCGRSRPAGGPAAAPGRVRGAGPPLPCATTLATSWRRRDEGLDYAAYVVRPPTSRHDAGQVRPTRGDHHEDRCDRRASDAARRRARRCALAALCWSRHAPTRRAGRAATGRAARARARPRSPPSCSCTAPSPTPAAGTPSRRG